MDLIGNKNYSSWRLPWALLLTLTLLGGCGGGGGGGGGGSTNNVGTTGATVGGTSSGSNHAPVVSNTPATSVNAGSAYSYIPAATDADGDVLTFSVTNAPSWATFSTSTGKLSGTPTNTNAGTTAAVVITASDGKTTTAVGPFSITVTLNNSGTATLSWVAPTTRQDGTPFSLSELRGYNVYGGTTSTNLSQVMSITNPTATTYTVSSLSPGTHYFAVTAFDTKGAESSYSNVTSKLIK